MKTSSRPKGSQTAAKKTTPNPPQDTHAAPAAVYEYGAVVAHRCVERISSPVLMCHHASGSTLNARSIANTMPASNPPSIAGNEQTRRDNSPSRMAPAVSACGATGAATVSPPAPRGGGAVTTPAQPPFIAAIVIFASFMIVRYLHAKQRQHSTARLGSNQSTD